MDKGIETMISNLHKSTGKTLEEWIAIVTKGSFAKHGEIISFLKEKHGLTYGYANLVAHRLNGSDAGSVENKDELIEKQYQGKEHFKPLYDQLMGEILKFGADIEVAPKNAYVSLRRKKQFAILQPATKTRFEIAVNLKGQAPTGRLEAVTASTAMCSHRINIADAREIDSEVIGWLKLAYDNAG
jgi:predicted transport protein